LLSLRMKIEWTSRLQDALISSSIQIKLLRIRSETTVVASSRCTANVYYWREAEIISAVGPNRSLVAANGRTALRLHFDHLNPDT
jgi:hypothetical protein